MAKKTKKRLQEAFRRRRRRRKRQFQTGGITTLSDRCWQQVDFLRYLEDLDDNIWILKIDIEGAEVPLLEALLDRSDLMGRIDHIFAETHERWIPDHTPRVKALRARASKSERPYINLDWH